MSRPSIGKPLFDGIRHCTRCGMPETSQDIDFDEMGVCRACRSSEQKMRINWADREAKLRAILDRYRSASRGGYDCIIPVSGGKDSAYQLYLLTKVYGMRPLAVTFSHNWFTDVGRRNLRDTLDLLGVDHVEFTPNRGLVNRLARESLFHIGDSCWHCHMGIDAWPLQAAVRFEIPLLIFGESVAEHSGKATYLDNPEYSVDYFLRYSALVTPKQIACGAVREDELSLMQWPSEEQLNRVGVTRIHLGDFIFWDAERQTEFVRDVLGWEEDLVEGTYKQYKSVECIMPGVHDYAKFQKRGFGRGMDFAVQDVRAGLATREEGFALHREHDPVRPKIMDYYLKITGLTEDAVEDALAGLRKGAAAREMPAPAALKRTEDRPVNQSVARVLSQVDEVLDRARRVDGLQTERLFPHFAVAARKSDDAADLDRAIASCRRGAVEAPARLSAAEQRDAIRDGRLSALELALDCVAAMDRLDGAVRAWAHRDDRAFLASARLVDRALAAGADPGPLAGVPVGVKDVFNTADLPTEMGSPIWTGFTPGNDARVVFNLRMAGALVAGKTATAEFAIHHPGPTVNPHDPTRSPGTSSSGSAAAVAARMTSLALGTQTAGSIIRPASYCGVYGMKPSFGVIPRTGVLKTADTLDHVGFLGAGLEDLALAFDAARVRGVNYPFVHNTLDVDAPDVVSGLPSRPLRVGFVRTPVWEQAHPQVRRAMTDYVDRLRAAGVPVDDVTLPGEFETAHDVHGIIYDKAVSYYFKEEYERSPRSISEEVRAMIARGRAVDLSRYEAALERQNDLELALAEIFASYDVLLSHATADVAGVGLIVEERPDPCLIWTLARAPVVNLPVLTGPHGLPVGVQALAGRYKDNLLLAFCRDLIARGLAPAVAAPAAVAGTGAADIAGTGAGASR